MKGVGRGMVGLVVKPMTGILDAASKVSEGIKTGADSDSVLHVRRASHRSLCLLNCTALCSGDATAACVLRS